MAVFCVSRMVFSFVIFYLFSRLTSCVFSFDIARRYLWNKQTNKQTNKQEKNKTKKPATLAWILSDYFESLFLPQ